MLNDLIDIMGMNLYSLRMLYLNKKKAVSASLAICMLCFFFSCSDKKVPGMVKRNELFTLTYGKFDNQLDLFSLASVGSINTYMTMRAGFFYIANGESQKIMELNSYGDLLTLFYNKEANKDPDFTARGGGNGTKKAVQYPFNTLGPIAVDSEKNLYVVDTLPKEQQVSDTEKEIMLDKIIVRFSSDGSYRDYLGQQGPGGTPFPFIRNIYTTDDDQIVVVCTTNDGPCVYWFSKDGYLQYIIPIKDSDVPNPYKNKKNVNNDAFVSVENVIPAHSGHLLYVKVDYYTTYVDQDSKVQSGIDYSGTVLYPLNIVSAKYGEPLKIPPYEQLVSHGFSKMTYNLPYDFIGVTDNGWLFFSIITDRGYIIQMVQPNGQKILKRTLELDNSKMLFYTFSFSDSGLISCLFAEQNEAKMIWWRTDSLIDALSKS